MLTVRRGRPRADASFLDAGRRPVMLATMEVRFDETAAAVAVDTAVECGQSLIVANVVEIPLGPLCVRMGYGALEPTEDDAANLRAPVELAHSLGVHVERLRVLSPHPVAALLEMVAERRPGLLVFGPDPNSLKPRKYRKVARAITESCACLVWLPD